MLGPRIGYVGVLKDWLIRTTSDTLRFGVRIVTLAHFQTYALLNAQCESMATDARTAEQKLHYTERSREHLWSLLGMSGVPVQESKSSSDANTDGVAQHSPFTASSSLKRTKERVGERSPTRDPVGEAQQQEKSTKCSFSGAIEVRVSEMIQEERRKAECPVCGATRTVRIQGSNVLFPPHPPRRTRTSRNEDRWIKEGTTWTLFQYKG